MRFVPSVGFVVAGLGLATTVAAGSGPFAAMGVGNVPGLVAALFATIAFAVRRHERGDRRFAVVAILGSAGLAVAAAAALVYPATIGGASPLGWAHPTGFVLGSLGVGIAYADWRGVERPAFVYKSAVAGLGLALGLAGLIVGTVLALAGNVVLPTGEPVLDTAVATALSEFGLGVTAVAYVRWRGEDWSFFDVHWPDRRDWAYVVGGVIAMFVILIAAGVVTSAIGVPSAQHSTIEHARKDPRLLLPFIPLSILVIGPGEELLFRNVVQKSMYARYARGSAIVVATVIFAAIHVFAYATAGPAAVFVTLLRLFGISLVLGVVYERTDNVVASALVHGTYDAIEFGLAFMALSYGIL